MFALASIVHHFPFIQIILWNENTTFEDLKTQGDFQELTLTEKDFADPDFKVVSTYPKKFIEEVFPMFFLKKDTFDYPKNFYFLASYF